MATSSGAAPLWITNAEVAALISMRDAISAVEAVLPLEADGAARNMTKTFVSWEPASSMHALGAAVEGEGIVGTKTWAATPRGIASLLLLWDAANGALRCVIEAGALSALRTGAVSGVAVRVLAAVDAHEMAIAGTGQQSLGQIAAVLAVRPIQKVRVFGRDRARREALVARIRDELECTAEGFDSVAAAVEGAPIITLVTRAAEPFLQAGMVSRGAHVNAVGAIMPGAAEFEPDLLDRCTIIAVDSPISAKQMSQEFIDFFGAGRGDWSALQPLSSLVKQAKGRPAAADVTLFKAMGMGLGDVALGMLCLDKALAQGAGHRLPASAPARLRLRA